MTRSPHRRVVTAYGPPPRATPTERRSGPFGPRHIPRSSTKESTLKGYTGPLEVFAPGEPSVGPFPVVTLISASADASGPARVAGVFAFPRGPRRAGGWTVPASSGANRVRSRSGPVALPLRGSRSGASVLGRLGAGPRTPEAISVSGGGGVFRGGLGRGSRPDSGVGGGGRTSPVGGARRGADDGALSPGRPRGPVRRRPPSTGVPLRSAPEGARGGRPASQYSRRPSSAGAAPPRAEAVTGPPSEPRAGERPGGRGLGGRPWSGHGLWGSSPRSSYAEGPLPTAPSLRASGQEWRRSMTPQGAAAAATPPGHGGTRRRARRPRHPSSASSPRRPPTRPCTFPPPTPGARPGALGSEPPLYRVMWSF